MTHVVESGLTRLLETETRLAEAVAAAEREAAALLSEARAASAAAAAEHETRLAREIEALARRVTADRDTAIAEARRRAEGRARRLRELPAGRIDELAAWAEARLLAADDHEARP